MPIIIANQVVQLGALSVNANGLLLPATVEVATGASLTVLIDGATNPVNAQNGMKDTLLVGDRVWCMQAASQTLIVGYQGVGNALGTPECSVTLSTNQSVVANTDSLVKFDALDGTDPWGMWNTAPSDPVKKFCMKAPIAGPYRFMCQEVLASGSGQGFLGIDVNPTSLTAFSPTYQLPRYPLGVNQGYNASKIIQLNAGDYVGCDAWYTGPAGPINLVAGLSWMSLRFER